MELLWFIRSAVWEVMCPLSRIIRLIVTLRLRPGQMLAYFGTFGYELDLLKIGEEKDAIRRQIEFMKEKRELIQKGTFYRLKSPFEGNEIAWMIVSEDQKEAFVGYYRVMQPINIGFQRLKLTGLREDLQYKVSGISYNCYGDELMQVGIILSDAASGVLKKV